MTRRDEILGLLDLKPVWVTRDSLSMGEGDTYSSNDSLERRSDRISALSETDLGWEIENCVSCGLHKERKTPVVGSGKMSVPWFFVGEGPGAEEDDTGLPFVGQAGKLLDNMFLAMRVSRETEVYIANVVKCRPPKNRAPSKCEVESCKPFLLRQIEIVDPKVIVCLGKTASNVLLDEDSTIANLRGKIHKYRDIPVIVTYHPAYLLRNQLEKVKAWEDLCLALKAMDN